MFQLTVSGLSGQVAVKHAVQDGRQDLFWFQQKMEARIVQAQKVEDAMQKNAKVKKQYKRSFHFKLKLYLFWKNRNQILFYYT